MYTNFPVVLLVGASGVVKKAIATKAQEKIPDLIGIVKSTTTRPPRTDPADRLWYEFVSREEFGLRRETGGFFQWVEAYGNFYGNSGILADAVLARRVGVVAVVEEAIQSFKNRYDKVYIIKIEAADREIASTRDLHRAEKDAERARLDIQAYLTIKNSFAPGGFDRAVEEFIDTVTMIHAMR